MALRTSILVAAVATGLIVSACYSPEVRDCAVRCSAANECADGLECGADNFCHTADHTDMCVDIDGGNPTIDADPNQPDADPTQPDATPSPDALMVDTDANTGVLLSIAVSGPGRVRALADGIDCTGDCDYYFDAGTELTLTAMPNNMNFTFDGWMGDECQGSTDPCTFTLNTETSMGASFSN